MNRKSSKEIPQNFPSYAFTEINNSRQFFLCFSMKNFFPPRLIHKRIFFTIRKNFNYKFCGREVFSIQRRFFAVRFHPLSSEIFKCFLAVMKSSIFVKEKNSSVICGCENAGGKQKGKLEVKNKVDKSWK
jgi:hypothetical protein